MYNYIFKGILHPQRAIISLNELKCKVNHVQTNESIALEMVVNLNHLTCVVKTDKEWDIHDLRNIVAYHCSNVVSIQAFMRGLNFVVEITEVIELDLKIDFVFGIGNNKIVNVFEGQDSDMIFDKLKALTVGERGLYINRVLKDLNFAISDTDDSPFYCYRAIESLKQYCGVKYSNLKTEVQQWEKLSEIVDNSEDDIKFIKDSAKMIRHGDISVISESERQKCLSKTWEIVLKFILNIDKTQN